MNYDEWCMFMLLKNYEISFGTLSNEHFQRCWCTQSIDFDLLGVLLNFPSAIVIAQELRRIDESIVTRLKNDATHWYLIALLNLVHHFLE